MQAILQLLMQMDAGPFEAWLIVNCMLQGEGCSNLLIWREEDRSISTSVYRKPTQTDRYLDFSSHHPQANKAAARTLINWTQSLSSSVLARTDEEVQVTTALQSNGYPSSLSETRPPHSQQQEHLTPIHHRPAALYIKCVSEAIHRILSQLYVRTNFRPAQTLALAHIKDSVPPNRD